MRPSTRDFEQPTEPSRRGSPLALGSARQRRGVAMLLVVGCGVVGYRLWGATTVVPDPPPELGPRAGEVANRVDPNVADWPTLAALPTLGDVRAQAIVAYRERVAERRPGQTVFARPTDLARVEGIGVGIIRQLRPFLIFPGESPGDLVTSEAIGTPEPAD